MRRLAVLMIGALSAALLLAKPAVAANKGPLDGKVFSSEVGLEGRTTGQRDKLVFQDGTFRSTACDPFGFKEGMYKIAQADDITTFEAQTLNPDGETMLWRGNIKGRHIEGRATWAKAGQEPVEHWFKGDLTE